MRIGHSGAETQTARLADPQLHAARGAGGDCEK